MRGIVYAAREKSTGKFYIGLTTRGLSERKRDHLYKVNNGSQSGFHKKIRLNGINSFSWVVLDVGKDSNELAKKERFYIQKYDSKNRGYNSDSGGGIKKKIFSYTLDGALSETFESLEQAAKMFQLKKKQISKACLNVNHRLKNRLWSYLLQEPFTVQDSRKKKVLQLNLDGELVAKYPSVSEAAKVSGLSKTSISRCCRGERAHAGGYNWKYN